MPSTATDVKGDAVLDQGRLERLGRRVLVGLQQQLNALACVR
jgi:hypothetical protein